MCHKLNWTCPRQLKRKNWNWNLRSLYYITCNKPFNSESLSASLCSKPELTAYDSPVSAGSSCSCRLYSSQTWYFYGPEPGHSGTTRSQTRVERTPGSHDGTIVAGPATGSGTTCHHRHRHRRDPLHLLPVLREAWWLQTQCSCKIHLCLRSSE